MIKKALLIAVIFNSIILIGIPSGHGYGIMILIEYLGIAYIIENGFTISKEFPIEGSLLLSAIVSFIGKLMIVIILFAKKIIHKKSLIYIGLSLMLIAFILICYKVWSFDSFLFIITLGSGIPFILYYARVLYLINLRAEWKSGQFWESISLSIWFPV